MDFTFTPEQQALGELAGRILADHATSARLRAVETDPDWFDRAAWADLARARLLGVALPEAVGGSGLGFLELCLVLEQVGRTVAPVPAWAALVLGAAPLAAFGDASTHDLLRRLAAGDAIVTAALVEPAGDPTQPATTATRDGGEWRLDGVKTCVPALHLAARVLVPARTRDGVAVFVVDSSGPGVQRARQVATTREPLWQVELAGAPATPLGDPAHGGAILDWLLPRALVGLCAEQLGVVDRALRMTAEYTTSRQQFDRPVASFQAVHQRAADAWIDVEAIRLTTWQAAWRLADGLPAATEAAIAKFWAAEGGHRVAYAAQHLHGGIGVDVDYPLHRHYLWAKQLELTLGGATAQLAKLGSQLATA
jgi:alkylation response protein AidB-like acyl-CoA dehydrogenase